MARKQVKSVAGMVVAITGGARGIGKCTAQSLIRRGARVAIGDLHGELAEETAAELGGNCVAFELDVTDRESFSRFLDSAESELGPIDVVINNAGIMPIGPFIEETDETAKTMIDIARPVVSRRKGLVEGHVIHVDAFGNLITSLGAEHIPPEASIEVEGTAGVFHPVFARTFSDVRAGAMVAYVGSGGQLEIARRNGSAARHIGAERGAIVRVEAA